MATARKSSAGTLYCDFCGKSQHEVRKLIAGPKNYICDECIDVCADIVAEDDQSTKVGPTDYFEQRRFDRKAKHIFYACPFRERFDDIYTRILKPAIVSKGWTIERADENFATGVVIRQVWEAINCCEVVVADVTDRSANVMYEIGMSHALHKPLMMVTQSENDVPFDLRHHRFVIYSNDDGGLSKLCNALCKMTETFDAKRTVAAPQLSAAPKK